MYITREKLELISIRAILDLTCTIFVSKLVGEDRMMQTKVRVDCEGRGVEEGA